MNLASFWAAKQKPSPQRTSGGRLSGAEKSTKAKERNKCRRRRRLIASITESTFSALCARQSARRREKESHLLSRLAAKSIRNSTFLDFSEDEDRAKSCTNFRLQAKRAHCKRVKLCRGHRIQFKPIELLPISDRRSADWLARQLQGQQMRMMARIWMREVCMECVINHTLCLCRLTTVVGPCSSRRRRPSPTLFGSARRGAIRFACLESIC